MENISEINGRIAKKLIYYRKAAGFTQAELAEKINYSDKSVSKWEQGNGVPDIYILMQLANIYGVTVDDIVGDGAPTPPKKRVGAMRMLIILLSSGISIFMSTFMKNIQEFELLAPIVKFLVRLTPFILTWGMFTALYIFMPNTKVKLKHAIIPGILAGTAFQAFQYLYIGSQIWVSRYNAIYGSFAAIPMFLLWTQISWSICLFGAQLCYVAQNLRNFSFSKETENISRRYHDFLCILIMSLICKRFQTEKEPYTAESLSDEHKIPIRLTTTILYELQDLHMIYETQLDGEDEVIAYLPAVDINQMNVAMLLNRLDTAGSEAFKIDRNRYNVPWEALTQAREDYYENTSHILLKDL